MEKHHFKKRFGQNFLNDPNILKKINNSISPNPEDLIIEIGPGSGNLTKYLQEYNCNLLCYEIDLSLKEQLESIKNDKTIIIFKDFLNTNLEEDIKNIKHQDIYIVANIPYYITTPIIEKIINSNIKIKSMILMMQKEVAERLTAKPKTKDYGYFTVITNCFYETTLLFNVNRNCFYPIPNVDSAVVLFKPINRNIKDFKSFDLLIKSAFKQRRKKLKNNLKQYDIAKIEKILNKHNYSLNNRAEDIPLELFIEIEDNL